MESLVNFDGIGEIGIELIDKLSDGVGWIVTRGTPKKIAVSTFIEDIQNSSYDPITKAALISHAKEIIKEYTNQYNIVKNALNLLKDDAQPKEIDNDWLYTFMDKTRIVSNDEFQLIWSQILARECNAPGSIPRALLYTLDRMDKVDAEAFTSLCRITIEFGEEFAPLIDGSKLDDYERFGIKLEELIDLEALGLIETDLGPFKPDYAITTESLPSEVIYFDNKLRFSDKKELDVGNVVYSKVGKALYKCIRTEEMEGFWEEYC